MYGLVSYWQASNIQSRFRPAGEQVSAEGRQRSEFYWKIKYQEFLTLRPII